MYDTTVMAHKVAEAFFSNTWFSTECVIGIVRTTRGTMAGMSLADLIYTITFARVLFTCRESLKNEGLHSQFDKGPYREASREVAFVDDVMHPVLSDASNVVAKVVAVVQIIATTFAIYGLEVNLAFGKTNALVLFVGAFAKKYLKQLVLNAFQMLVRYSKINAILHFVDLYKHVGTQSSVTHDMNSEIAVRAEYIGAGMKSFAKIFRNPHLAHKREISLSKAYLMAGGTYQSSTWPNLNITQYR